MHVEHLVMAEIVQFNHRGEEFKKVAPNVQARGLFVVQIARDTLVCTIGTKHGSIIALRQESWDEKSVRAG